MSAPTRSAVFAAWAARAAFSSRQTCHGPGKKSERPASSSSTPVVTASRNQRSCATRITAASSDCELLLEPLEVLDVEVVRRLVEQQQVGVAGERAGQRGARQLAAGEGRQRPVEVALREAEPAQRRRRPVAPGVAAGVLEPRLGLGVAPQRRLVVVAGRHRLLEPGQLLLGLDQVARAA